MVTGGRLLTSCACRPPQVCPSPSDVTPWRWTATPADFQHPFLLQVSSYDRVGVLHGARCFVDAALHGCATAASFL